MLKSLKFPALFLFFASLACSFIFGYGMGLIPILIQEALAFVFAAGLVRIGKGNAAIWINYIIWFLMLNLGDIASAIGCYQP